MTKHTHGLFLVLLLILAVVTCLAAEWASGKVVMAERISYVHPHTGLDFAPTDADAVHVRSEPPHHDPSHPVTDTIPMLWIGMDMSFDVTAIAVDPTENQNIYAAGYHFAYSRNGGQTWSTESSGLPSPARIVSLAIDPVSPSYLYAGTGSGSSRAIYRSDSRGVTWSKKDDGIPTNTVIAEFDVIAVHPITPTIVLAWAEVEEPCAFRSANRGDTWTTIGPPALCVNVRQLVFDPHDSRRVFAVASSGVQVSNDVGLTWSPSGIQADWLALDPQDAHVMYKFLGSDLFRSDDAGQSWNVITTPHPPGTPWPPGNTQVYVDPADSDVLYIVSYDRPVMRTVNGGQTWISLDQVVNGPVNGVMSFSIDPVNTAQLYAFQLTREPKWDLFRSVYLTHSVYLPTISN